MNNPEVSNATLQIDIARLQTDVVRLQTDVQRVAGDVALIAQSLPATYVKQEAFEKRVEGMSTRIQVNADTAERVNQSNLAWTNQLFGQTKDAVNDKTHALQESIYKLQLTLYGTLVGGVLVPVILVLVSHYWK